MTTPTQTHTARGRRWPAHVLAAVGLVAALAALYLRGQMTTGAVGFALATLSATFVLALTGLGWLGLGLLWRRRRGPARTESARATLRTRALPLAVLAGVGAAAAISFFGALASVGMESFPSVAPLWTLLLIGAALSLACAPAWLLALAARGIAASPLPRAWARLRARWASLPLTERLFTAGVAAVLGWQWLLAQELFDDGILLRTLPPAAVMLAVLFATRGRRAELRAGTVVGLAAALYLGFFLIDIESRGLATFALSGPPGIADHEIRTLFSGYGQSFLDSGRLPLAEYPPGSLATFALATFLGPIPFTLPLLVLPVVLAGWWALSRLGPDAPWLAGCAALWPTLVPFWEVKFDPFPTALMILGLVAASRRSWTVAGLLLGLAAATKWYPGLAVPVLAAGLVGRREVRSALRLVGGSIAAFALLTLPFLGQVEALLAPYRAQGGRDVTGASFPFLPAHALGLATPPRSFEAEALTPDWLASVSVGAIVLTLGVLLVLAWRRPERALILAAAAPAGFLLLNRIYSPQFMLPLAALWVFAAALQPFSPRRRMATVAFLAVAATANFAVWPLGAEGHWIPVQWVMFIAAFGASLAAFSGGSGGEEPSPRVEAGQAPWLRRQADPA